MACRFIEENGFDERLVLNTDVKKVEDFLGGTKR